jgi:hypothetical protein
MGRETRLVACNPGSARAPARVPGVWAWRRGGTILQFSGSARCGGMSSPVRSGSRSPGTCQLRLFVVSTDLASARAPAPSSPGRSRQSSHYYILKPDFLGASRALRCGAVDSVSLAIVSPSPPPSSPCRVRSPFSRISLFISLFLESLFGTLEPSPTPPTLVQRVFSPFVFFSFRPIQFSWPRPLPVFPVSRRTRHASRLVA